MKPDRLPTHVARACRDLLPDGARVLVAVSGGADSLALLHLLAAQAPGRGWTLAVAHFNHRQDPGIDDLAVATLSALAATMGLAFHTAEADLPPGSAEAALRAARYRFLGDVARRWQASHVAVAHHGDDQAETLLLRLLRGAVAGLGGMRPSRPLDERTPAVLVIRPLLQVRRRELHAYCQAHGLQPIEDPSNAERRFRRNVLRADVLPTLERHWPGAGPVLARTARWLQEDDDWLQAQAESVLATLPPPPADLPVAALAALPGPLRRRLLRAALRQRGVPPLDSGSLAAVEAVIAGERVGTPLPGDWQLRRHGGHLSVTAAATASPAGLSLALTLTEGGIDLPGLPYRLTIRPATPADHEDAWQIRLPIGFDAAGSHWRNVLAGDRLVTRAGRQKVTEILRRRGLSPTARRSQLVLADGTGVLWVVGVRRSDRLPAPAAGDPAWLVRVARIDRPEC